jgi:hypothetical protein
MKHAQCVNSHMDALGWSGDSVVGIATTTGWSVRGSKGNVFLVHAMMAYRRGDIAPPIRNLGIRWRHDNSVE